jgi:CRP/FNR family cyclic AMP-dependent transcriptional regulator
MIAVEEMTMNASSKADTLIGPAGDALEASRILGVLSDVARRRLVAQGSSMSLQAGEFLCRVGDEADAAYVVMSGELEVRTVGLDGQELRFAAFTSGSLVGEMAVLDGGARSADLAAARRTNLWRIPRQALLRTLEEEPTAALAVIAELSQRLRALNETYEQMARLDLGGRLAVLLLAECNRNGWVDIGVTGVLVRQSPPLESLTRSR